LGDRRIAVARAALAIRRSAAALAGEPYEPLTAAELGHPWKSGIQVHKAIKQARVELFGEDLCNSAIFYRLKKRRERRGKELRGA